MKTNFTTLLFFVFSITISLQAQQEDFKVNDDQGDSDQKSSSICTDDNGNFVITWKDSRNSYKGDIYAQRYSSDGSPLGTNFMVNDDQVDAKQELPEISSDPDGNFVITWFDDRNGMSIHYDIYAQRYLSDGTPQGTNILVNDDQGWGSQIIPSICTDNSGNFVISWNDSRSGGYSDIYAQRYSSDGSPQGTNFKANEDQQWGCGNCFVAIDGSGNFMITWQDDRNGYTQPDIYAQLYANDGTLQGTNFRVNDDQAGMWQSTPSICADNNDNFLVAWHDDRNGDNDIFMQHYANDGTAIGTNIKVSDDPGSTSQSYTAICADNNGNYMITWNDYRDGIPNFYTQRYNNDGSAEGGNVKVVNTSETEMFIPSVKLCNGFVYITWTDDRTTDNDYDIWANILEWGDPTEVSEELSSVPSSYILRQNYPNPFNPSTNISFSLNEDGFVLLNVYNILGENIATLVNENHSAGQYTVQFNGANLPSGVYLYTLQSNGRFFIMN